MLINTRHFPYTQHKLLYSLPGSDRTQLYNLDQFRTVALLSVLFTLRIVKSCGSPSSGFWTHQLIMKIINNQYQPVLRPSCNRPSQWLSMQREKEWAISASEKKLEISNGNSCRSNMKMERSRKKKLAETIVSETKWRRMKCREWNWVGSSCTRPMAFPTCMFAVQCSEWMNSYELARDRDNHKGCLGLAWRALLH